MTRSLIHCPRCEAAAIIIGHTGALSRTTRDEGAAVTICDRCGERESLYGRRPDQIPFVDWPVSIERLLAEEEALIRRVREGEIGWLATDEIEGTA